MPRTTLPDDGERMVPEYHRGLMLYGEHVARYGAAKMLVSNKTVLDIACGSGYGSSILAEDAKKVVGIDIDKRTVDYAAKEYKLKNTEFLVGDATSIPLQDSSVDVVVSFETIEHIQDYKKFIGETDRVLKPDGILIISTPNKNSYIENNPFHRHEFTYEEFVSLLKNYFSIIDTYFQSTWLYNSILNGDMLNKSWVRDMNTWFTIESKPQAAVYFIALCSNSSLPKLRPLGAVSQPWSAKQEVMYAKELERINGLTKQHIANLEKKISILDSELHLIRQSFLYKLLKPWLKIKSKSGR